MATTYHAKFAVLDDEYVGFCSEFVVWVDTESAAGKTSTRTITRFTREPSETTVTTGGRSGLPVATNISGISEYRRLRHERESSTAQATFTTIMPPAREGTAALPYAENSDICQVLQHS